MEQIGNVNKLGLVYWFEDGKDGPGENPLFNDKVVISRNIVPDAEKVWPGDRHMAAYVHHENGLLLRYGILSFEAYSELGELPGDKHITIATEFPTLNAARRIFQLAVDAGIVDIYLYSKGKLYDKLD